MDEDAPLTKGTLGRSGYRAEDPLADLPPTAIRMVEAARRLVLERGYDALSLESICNESAVNKSAVRYYFGNKAGLIAVVVASVVHENMTFMLENVDVPEGESRIHMFMEKKREKTIENLALSTTFLELLPHILRNEGYTTSWSDLYEWCMGVWGRFFAGEVAERDAEEIRVVAQVVVAVVDGLIIQYAMDAERFKTSRAFALFESMLVKCLKDKTWFVDDAFLTGAPSPDSSRAPSPAFRS